MTPEFKLFQLRQHELEQAAKRERQAAEARRAVVKQTPAKSARANWLARVAALF